MFPTRKMDQQLWDAVTENTPNCLEVVKDLIMNQGAMASALNENKQTMLHIVAEKGNFAVLQYFLSCNFLVNSQDQSGNTALHYAVMKDHYECAELLLQYGADPLLANNEGQSAQAFAKTEDLVRLFIRIQSQNLLTSSVPSPMVCVASSSQTDSPQEEPTIEVQFLAAVAKGDKNTFDELIGIVNNVNYQDEAGETALHIACYLERVNFVLPLLMAGAKVDICDKKEKKPADYVKEHKGILKLLNKYSVNIEYPQPKKHSSINLSLSASLTSSLGLSTLSLSESLSASLGGLGILPPESPRDYETPSHSGSSSSSGERFSPAYDNAKANKPCSPEHVKNDAESRKSPECR
jgi:ankyrin repeat protein